MFYVSSFLEICVCAKYIYTHILSVCVCVCTHVCLCMSVFEREIHKVPMKLDACGTDRNRSTQQTLHPLYPISSPLVVGWGHGTGGSQGNVRSDLSHFQVEAMKSSCQVL